MKASPIYAEYLLAGTQIRSRNVAEQARVVGTGFLYATTKNEPAASFTYDDKGKISWCNFLQQRRQVLHMLKYVGDSAFLPVWNCISMLNVFFSRSKWFTDGIRTNNGRRSELVFQSVVLYFRENHLSISYTWDEVRFLNKTFSGKTWDFSKKPHRIPLDVDFYYNNKFRTQPNCNGQRETGIYIHTSCQNRIW